MFGSKLNKTFFERLQLSSRSDDTAAIIIIFVILISVTVTVAIIIIITIAVYNSHARKEEYKSRLTEFVAELEHRDKFERLFKSGKYILLH